MHRRVRVASGSHLDTQPEGGRFDGVYGVLAALEVVRTLNDAEAFDTDKPIEIVVWTNEKARASRPAMLESRPFTGVDATQARRSQHSDSSGGVPRCATRSQAISGTRAQRPVPGIVFDAYFEAHIEQGPVLEENGVPIGIVTGGQAIRWLDVRVHGQAAHAGTKPMPFRLDALFAQRGNGERALERHFGGICAARAGDDRRGIDSQCVAQHHRCRSVVHGRPSSSRRRPH